MKRVFEIELDVPDDFASKYNPPYLLGSRCVIANGVLAWNVYADPQTPALQWRKATASDEGKLAKFRDDGSLGWSEGKLLHVDSSKDGTVFLALINGWTSTEWFDFCEVQV
jgi:hypothetical protein